MTDSDDIQVRRETGDGMTILSPIGDIDLSRAPALRIHLSEALTSKPSRLIIDLAEVPYMDSSGVATFVEAMQIARKKGSELMLCSMQPRVRSIFEIARLDMVFKILDTADEAKTA